MLSREKPIDMRYVMMSVCVLIVSLVVLCLPELVNRALFVSGVMMTWSCFVSLVCLILLYVSPSVNVGCRWN